MAYFPSFERIAWLAILSAVGLGAAQARAEQPNLSPLRTHGPIEVHRLEDGSLARGPHNEFMTSNRSGPLPDGAKNSSCNFRLLQQNRHKTIVQGRLRNVRYRGYIGSGILTAGISHVAFF